MLVERDVGHHDRAERYHRQLESIGVLTCPELVRTLRWPVHAPHKVGLHYVVLVGHRPILNRQVASAIHFLEHRVLEGLVKSLDVAYRVVLVWYARLQLDRWLTQAGPTLNRRRDKLIVDS